jgi:hypothetical protein
MTLPRGEGAFNPNEFLGWRVERGVGGVRGGAHIPATIKKILYYLHTNIFLMQIALSVFLLIIL